MRSFSPSPEVLAAKHREVFHRGLMSYPVDSEDDKRRQAQVATMLADLSVPSFLQSPYSPLKMYVDSDTCPKMAYYFTVGDYEQGDMDLLARHLQKGDVVVEFGGGVGLTASRAGQITEAPVWVYEPNKALHTNIMANAELNGVDIRLEPYAVATQDYKNSIITMALSKEYWWSSISNPPADAVLTEVPCKRFDEIIAEKRPTAAIFDIEGYEAPLFTSVTREQLGSLKTAFIEIHAPGIGAETTCKLFNRLYDLGFVMTDFAGLSFVFVREPCHMS